MSLQYRLHMSPMHPTLCINGCEVLQECEGAVEVVGLEALECSMLVPAEEDAQAFCRRSCACMPFGIMTAHVSIPRPGQHTDYDGTRLESCKPVTVQ